MGGSLWYLPLEAMPASAMIKKDWCSENPRCALKHNCLSRTGLPAGQKNSCRPQKPHMEAEHCHGIFMSVHTHGCNCNVQ
jgi:hypothetical protein